MKTETANKSTEVQQKTLHGVVVSDAMDKTVVVKVERFVKHPKYHKFQKISKKYKVHDEQNTYKIGDTVDIVACRPLSKDKHFTVANTSKALNA